MSETPHIAPDPEPDSPCGSSDIDIAVMDPRWVAALGDTDALCAKAAGAAAAILERAQPADLSVALMDDADIQKLNAHYRGKDKPTNVLSFAPDGHNPVMGDIALAYETCAREAEAKRISLTDHFVHLLVHGYLHLSGYDHQTETDAGVMEALEISALARLGIANPYEDPNV